jgi:hypothetical protein
MKSFWLKFVIEEAIGIAEAFISISNIKPALKTALEKLITDGQAVIAAI